MDLKTQIALQDTVWRELQITVPRLNVLMKEFSEFVSKDLPRNPEDVPRFIAGEFASFLQPSPGFFLGREYTLEKIESAFGPLIDPGVDLQFYFRDTRCGWYWAQTESLRFGMHVFSYLLVSTRKPE